MRNIYGNRSIIPNNYYFTFDKIYQNEASLNANDEVLIGRTVLAKDEHTVHLKINGPDYLKIAKLDNEGRFIYYEGYVLELGQNIDKINSRGNTSNDDGTYIINKKNIIGTYPSVKGFKNNEYKEDSVFLLEQYSNNIATSFTELENSESAIEALSQGKTLYLKDENDKKYKIYKPKENISIDKENTYYILSKITVDTYQILTDITKNEINKDEKANNGIDKNKLNHKNKSFIRKYTFSYTPSTQDNDGEYTYKFDELSQKMIGTGNTTYQSNLFIKENPSEENNWSVWEDISEQYTGYLGALNGTGFNHTNEKYNDEKAAGEYLTLVDAINQLDKVIGSTNKRFGNKEVNANIANFEDDGGVILDSEDKRPINITETTLADAIVRHDADIGQIETVNTDNIIFNYDQTNIKLNATTDQAIINSVSDAIKVLDDIIGTLTTITNLNEIGSNRKNIDNNLDGSALDLVNAIKKLKEYIGTMYKIKNTDVELSFDNLVDTILKLKEYIGTMSDLNDEYNNVNTTNLVDAIEALNVVLGDLNSLTEQNEVKQTSSIVQAINAINKHLGDITSLNNQNGIDNTLNEGTLVKAINQINDLLGENVLNGKTTINEINYKTIINAIQKLDEYIGKINNNIQIQNKKDVKDLVTAVTKLNSALGDISNISTSDNNYNYNNVKSCLIDLNDIIGNYKKIVPTSLEGTTYAKDIASQLQYIYDKLDTKSEIKDFENLRRLINNLGENLDILDINVTKLMEGQNTSGNISMTWGTF